MIQISGRRKQLEVGCLGLERLQIEDNIKHSCLVYVLIGVASIPPEHQLLSSELSMSMFLKSSKSKSSSSIVADSVL
jgi:hypothetical protein